MTVNSQVLIGLIHAVTPAISLSDRPPEGQLAPGVHILMYIYIIYPSEIVIVLPLHWEV